MKTICIELKAYDRIEDQEFTVYLSNTGYISAAADTPPSTLFAPCLVSGYEYEQSVITEFGIAGGATLSIGAIEIALPEGLKIVTNATSPLTRISPQLMSRFEYRARPSGLIIKTSDDATAAYSTFTTVFTGTVDTWSATRDVLTIQPAARDVEFTKPLDANRYKGLGGAVRCNFDGGTGDYINVPDAVNLDQQTTFSYEWVGIRTGDSGNSTQVLAQKAQLYSLEMDSSFNLIAWLADSSDVKHILTSTSVLSSDNISQVSVVWRGTLSSSDMFVDGVNVNATYSTGSQTQSLTGDLRMGMGNTGTEAEVDIMQFRLWNDIRTDDEVYDNLWLQLDGTEQGIAGSWMMNEGTGSTTADDANSNTGTLTGGASWVHSLEGDDYNLRGLPKPISEGQVLNRPAVLVDELRLIYDVADGGFDKIHTVYANRDSIELDTTVGTAGDTTNLFANSPLAAKYIFDSTKGRIKLGSNYGDNVKITCDVQVGATGSIKPASVFENFVTNWAPGFTGSDFVTSGNTVAAHNALMTTNTSSGIGLTHEETRAIDHLSAFMMPLASFWAFDRSGKIFLIQTPPPNSVSADHTLTAEEVVVNEVEVIYPIPPSKDARLGYDKFWYVHTASEVSATAASADLKLFERSQKEFIYHDIKVHDDVETDYPGAIRRVLEGYTVYEWKSGTDVNRNQTLRPILNKLRFLLRDDRRVFRMPVARLPSPDDEFNLGEIVTFDFSSMSEPPFDLSTSVNLIIVGILQTDLSITLTCWG